MNKKIKHKVEVEPIIYRHAFEKSIDGMLILDIDGNILYGNPAAQKTFGFDEDTIGIKARDFLTKESGNLLRTVVLPTLLEKGTWSGELAAKRPDGQEMSVLATSSVIIYEAGPQVILVIYRDITERKKMEDKLRESEELFRTVFEKSVVGKSLTSPEGKLLKVNPAFANMLGYSIEEMEKINFAQVTHPDDLAISHESIRCLLAGERTIFRFEKRYIHKNGSIVWTDVSTTLLRNAAGQPLYFITSIVDITERKRMEEALRVLATIVESSDDAIISKTLDGTIVSWNKGAERIYGYKAEEVIGKPVSILVPNGMPDEIPAILKRIKHDERIENYQTLRKKKDGTIINISLTVSPIKDEKGNITGASAIAHDITERKKM